ncbi:MAG: hypothetical protein G01um101477_260 [Candidatus Doudnabacteria bacterium Gr01-1014_77]|uniref:YoaR-like putative peptidoglycan binding domain-containing protein n=1 Tax=Candidatus Doudnabacteria bacterium Gr01-1014_77 TaxID=2017133 RepID=A0A554JCB3_9BACT|nr:MAG: hypothetical protein G01um101477_260 [Candidatus Doudnabacteria bacterium Gr01-1014_77]
MLKRILKYNIGLLILGVVFFSLSERAQAFTLVTEEQEFNIPSSDFKVWQKPTATSLKFVALEPEKNAEVFVLTELGLRNKTKTKSTFVNYNVPAIYSSLKDIASEINGDPEDAVFKTENGVAVEFNPGRNGRDLDTKSSIDQIVSDLDEEKTQSTLVINETESNVKLSDTNDMGINELIAFGESNYSGSPANRIFNIKVGVNKEKGTILAQGETFSFNKYLGPVDGEHGFLPELVIKKEGTVPEFGGGLCQVSSTMFRAAMKAGFPITERRNHSYAVQYYAPQGTDATIYPGSQDLKFINDSPAHILIWPVLEKGNHLRFYIYGTKDERKVEFDAPYTYDKQPDGSMKANWGRTVTTTDGTIKKEVFKSVYQSPALFHKTLELPGGGTPVENTDPVPTPPPTQTNSETSNTSGQ